MLISHVVTVLTAAGKRILVEDAHFHTDSSVFLPRDPGGASGAGVDAPRPFSNDAFWDSLKPSQSNYVDSAKLGAFVPPEEADGGDDPGRQRRP